jgi:hypothetical protein
MVDRTPDPSFGHLPKSGRKVLWGSDLGSGGFSRKCARAGFGLSAQKSRPACAWRPVAPWGVACECFFLLRKGIYAGRDWLHDANRNRIVCEVQPIPACANPQLLKRLEISRTAGVRGI